MRLYLAMEGYNSWTKAHCSSDMILQLNLL